LGLILEVIVGQFLEAKELVVRIERVPTLVVEHHDDSLEFGTLCAVLSGMGRFVVHVCSASCGCRCNDLPFTLVVQRARSAQPRHADLNIALPAPVMFLVAPAGHVTVRAV
jgi:hypothetical protein